MSKTKAFKINFLDQEFLTNCLLEKASQQLDLSIEGDIVLKEIWRLRLSQSFSLLEQGAESPIEKIFGNALFFGLFANGPSLVSVPLGRNPNNEPIVDEIQNLVQSTDFHLIPNFWIDKKTRVDFVLANFADYTKTEEIGPLIVIECDGFRWHNSPDSFAKESARERRIITAGHHLFRFSGREINEDPISAVNEILDFIAKKQQDA